jgi:outer membrane protein assembly factor BamB
MTLGLRLAGIILLLAILQGVGAADARGQTSGISAFPKLSAESDWPWWRGPSRNGIAPDAAAPPVRWSETDNVVWQTPVPGRGHSSPIVVGNRVYLATADASQQTQSVLAFDRGTGKPVWTTVINQGGFPASIHPKNTHATSTIACDGQRLFVTFFNHEAIQAAALGLDGKLAWEQAAGPFNPRLFQYGYGPSPTLYGETVIVAAEYDGDSFLAALDRRTGERVWRTPRPFNITFSTPVVAHISGQDQLLMSGANKVVSYNPETGAELWSAPGTTAATCGTMVWDGDIVVASGGYPKAQTLAIRADGSGQVLWRNSQKCYEQSLLAHAGLVYALTDGGTIFCWRIEDGKEMWRRRLQGPVSASPVLAGGNIYWANELGTMYVFKPNPHEFELVAENQLGQESFASPAVSSGQIFLLVASESAGKRQETLYCIGDR